MTTLIANARCRDCAGTLVPPMLKPDVLFLYDVDYVCLSCGRGHVWIGNPPVLVRVGLDGAAAPTRNAIPSR